LFWHGTYDNLFETIQPVNLSMSIEIKGVTFPALLVKFDPELTIEKNLEELEEKLSSAFFKNSVVTVDPGIMNFTDSDKKKIEKAIEQSNAKFLGYRSNVDATGSGSVATRKKQINSISEKKSLRIINKTLRNGQRIEYDGDVMIFGDVNPGAYVIASGNIIVMGVLRGVVHAGARGDESTVVIALKLNAQQLRIGNYITRAPDDAEVESPDKTEKAYVKDNQILIEQIKV